MSYEDVVRIQTPEGVDLELTLAGLGSRIAAAVLDSLIRGAIYIALALALGGLSFFTEGVDPSLLFVTVFLPVALFVETSYDIAFEVLAGGRTIGKRAAGLRVIKATGAPVDFRASAVRNLVRLVDGVLTGYTAAVIAILVTPRNQRLGDLAAGTIVIRERRGTEESQGIVYAYVGGDARPPPWDMSAVTADDLATLRRFLERRASLDREARHRLADQLADAMRAKIVGAPQMMHPEEMIEHVVRARSSA